MKYILSLFLVFGLLFNFPVYASDECQGLKVGTGSPGKGYSRLFKNIQQVCGQEIKLCEVNSSGGLDNLDLMSTNKVDIGLVQVDTWYDMKNGDQNIADFKAVMPVNFDYVHFLVPANGVTTQGAKKWGFLPGETKTVYFTKVSELRGRSIALIGSAQLLVRKLDRQLGTGFQFVDVANDAAAFKMLQSGQVAAVATISSWPSGTVGNLKQSDGLTLIPFDLPASTPYFVKSLNYKNLGVYNVNFLAVPSMILTRPFTTSKAGGEVDKLRSCIQKNLVDLKEGSYEPGWKDVSNVNETYGIPAFRASSVAKK